MWNRKKIWHLSKINFFLACIILSALWQLRINKKNIPIWTSFRNLSFSNIFWQLSMSKPCHNLSLSKISYNFFVFRISQAVLLVLEMVDWLRKYILIGLYGKGHFKVNIRSFIRRRRYSSIKLRGNIQTATLTLSRLRLTSIRPPHTRTITHTSNKIVINASKNEYRNENRFARPNQIN